MTTCSSTWTAATGTSLPRCSPPTTAAKEMMISSTRRMTTMEIKTMRMTMTTMPRYGRTVRTSPPLRRPTLPRPSRHRSKGSIPRIPPVRISAANPSRAPLSQPTRQTRPFSARPPRCAPRTTTLALTTRERLLKPPPRRARRSSPCHRRMFLGLRLPRPLLLLPLRPSFSPPPPISLDCPKDRNIRLNSRVLPLVQVHILRDRH